MQPRTRLLAACAAVALGGCVSVAWERDSWATPPPPVPLEELVGRQAELSRVLALLGAPLDVWEHRTDGLVLLYGWRVNDGKNLNVSVPVTQDASASFDYMRGRSELRGVLLLFDVDWRLASAREGWLVDLSAEKPHRRPAGPDDLEVDHDDPKEAP